jgi:hypothetical protein
MQQEGLETEHTRVVQRTQLRQVPRHRAAPEPDIDVDLRARGRPLALQGGNVDRRWDAVQRHVDQRGDPAERRRTGGRGEALPVGAPRLVDVHMGVDESGQQDLVVGPVDEPVSRDGIGERRAVRFDRTIRPSPTPTHRSASLSAVITRRARSTSRAVRAWDLRSSPAGYDSRGCRPRRPRWSGMIFE